MRRSRWAIQGIALPPMFIAIYRSGVATAAAGQAQTGSLILRTTVVSWRVLICLDTVERPGQPALLVSDPQSLYRPESCLHQ
jgi:hypothetical protein